MSGLWFDGVYVANATSTRGWQSGEQQARTQQSGTLADARWRVSGIGSDRIATVVVVPGLSRARADAGTQHKGREPDRRVGGLEAGKSWVSPFCLR